MTLLIAFDSLLVLRPLPLYLLGLLEKICYFLRILNSFRGQKVAEQVFALRNDTMALLQLQFQIMDGRPLLLDLDLGGFLL